MHINSRNYAMSAKKLGQKTNILAIETGTDPGGGLGPCGPKKKKTLVGKFSIYIYIYIQLAPPYIVEPLQNHEPLIQSMKILKKKKKANPNFIK